MKEEEPVIEENKTIYKQEVKPVEIIQIKHPSQLHIDSSTKISQPE